MRTIIIGDIHGCADALHALVDLVAPDPKKDVVVLLGDLFDRGPDSFDVFQQARELADAFDGRFALLRGNHEDYLLTEKLPVWQRLVWERVGRGSTVKSFKAHGAQMEDAIPWVREHCALFYRGEGFQCVHAGLMVDPIEVNDAQTMMHDHEIALRNCYRGPLTVVGHVALESPTWFIGDGKRIEKLPDNRWLELPKTGTICIDTGCGKGGRLTAMQVEGSRYLLTSVAETGRRGDSRARHK